MKKFTMKMNLLCTLMIIVRRRNRMDGACRWSSSSPESTLSGINFSVSENQLVAIIGPVGSGKTTLLHVLLKELSLEGGTLEVNGRVSYASQEPWLFGGSVRQNILFGQEYNENKYKEVVRVCALERDFTLFPYGDKTIVGERGTMLSGGQRARINLARAVYKDADIYLLDDPLSAVDTHVGKQLFEDCISKYLGDKCVVLVTHQLQYLHKVSRIDLLEDGKISISGTYQQLQNSGRDFTNLLNEHKDEHNDDEEKKDRKSKHEVMEEDKPGEPTEVKEHVEKGKISGEVYRRYFKAGGRLWQAFAMLIIFILAQVIGNGNDYFVTWWVNYEQDKLAQANFTNTTETFWDTVFFEYNGLYIYTSFAVMVVVMVVSRSVIFYKFCMVASRKLHDNMFNNVVFATMEFFNNNPSGRILNRFSKDMGAVDENLPGAMIDTIQIGLNVLGISIVVGIVNPWVLLSTVVILTIFYGIRVVYLATSRNIKRMEGTTRSPVFSHLSASLQGLTTIRAFGAQEILREEFDKHQNLHSSAFYMFLVAGKTFGFWLDFHCVIYIALVVVSFLFIEKESYGGNVGLAITQSMGLCGQFQWGMRQWSELENMMTAVERVLEYTEIKPEPQGVVKEPPKFWPEEGNVKFESVYMKYSENEPFVLKDLSFDVKRGEKVGIVGRTGAGKSSLVSALFRLCQIEGKIIIDNVNTKEISLENLRSKISIIPQEPVLFSGTLRKNLDPFDHHNDDVIWSALEQVELKGAIDDLASGLESKISEGGSNFSVGQRQLLCLARAIIRKNKILILDEATANVDPQTDALIQTTIRDKFGDCTVLTIAHRLNTIMDSDKVLVMDSGTVVEFDHPHNLLQNKDGIFASLVKQTGRAMSDNLTAIAEMNYNMRKDE
ncbi:unnamed protein product [Brassicogethes aeneus]|uniref:Multidrug resistance-associated protein lethal(2)03659 n=1 Tax=Brassicogethes aeneus TaxID=1431903 RepID=A0A9P0B985_BRAAE|nr:unnamed protein product [Brassicogethes aeneus]